MQCSLMLTGTIYWSIHVAVSFNWKWLNDSISGDALLHSKVRFIHGSLFNYLIQYIDNRLDKNLWYRTVCLNIVRHSNILYIARYDMTTSPKRPGFTQIIFKTRNWLGFTSNIFLSFSFGNNIVNRSFSLQI